MELFRPSGRATKITFPIKDLEGRIRTGASSLDSEWVAWSDTAEPNAAGNPGFVDMAGETSELSTTGVYTLAVAAAELPAASPYVMIRVMSGNAATQYILIRTASTYANVTGINGTNIATPITAGYMPMDVKQPINLSAPTDNSVEKSLARTYMASPFATVSTVSGAVWDEVILSAHTTDNTTGKLAARLYFATQYLDAAVSAGVSPPSAATVADAVWDEVITVGHSTDNTAGLMAARLYQATKYLDAAVSSRSTYAGGDTSGTTTLLTRLPSALTVTSGAVNLNQTQALTIPPSPATGTVGQSLVTMKYATDYLDAAITSRLAPTTAARTLDVDTAGGVELGSIQTGAITSGAFAAGAIDAAAVAANAIGASEFAQDAAQEIADEVLNRNLVGGGSGSTYNVRNAFRRLRNRVQITGGNMLVYDETDTATAYAMSVTTAAGNPITEVDPIT